MEAMMKLKLKVLFITFFILIIPFHNLKAANLAVGFISQFALSGANTNASKVFPSGFRDFDSGFAFSIGVNQPINSSSMSFSVLLDLGYYHDSYDLRYTINGKRATENYQFDSFLIGGYARFNFSFISLGAGGGVKIPGSATYKLDSYNKYRFYRFSFGDLSDIFESAVIPYVRFSIDFSIFNYWMIGVYANYDFPLHFQHNNYISDTIINNNSLSALDIGIQFGYYINIDFNK
ncbi:hypothetical protein R4K55_11480 [Brachyspira alvinipulli]|uniref:hypothetical protein n=1 Tax=Brachyspira alvinipulli TaxID=84379 RepID=UPI00262DCA84|nr:hypothetical protein [uncultured Brachyspira sp.]